MARVQPTYQEFIGQILRPMNLTSLKPQYEAIRILVHRRVGEEPEELEINTLYPYHTIQDLLTQIYVEKENEETFHPYHQCLLISNEDGTYKSFQYIFNDGKIKTLQNPFTLAQTASRDPQFAEYPKTVSLNALTLETALFQEKKTEYVFHLFLFTDILASFTGVTGPISDEFWNGLFRIYFPLIDKEYEDGRIPKDVLAFTPTRVERFLARTELIDKMDELLATPLRRPGEMGRGDPVSLASFRNLRIAWRPFGDSKFYKPFRIDEVFYDMPVSERIPYIRFFPKATTPISKVFVKGSYNQPAMDSPDILLKWSQEESITPQEDLICAKVLIRPGAGSVNPLYATFFIFQDGSAKFILQPNQDMSNIPRAELLDLGEVLQSLTEQVPKQQPRLGKGPQAPARSFFPARNAFVDDLYSILNLGLEREDTPITPTTLRLSLPYFRSFFQVTASPIKEQNPIAFLRYKAVDNFQSPTRDFQFLGRVMDLKKLSGEMNAPALIKYYMEEFDVDEAVARKRVGLFFKNESNYELTNPEIRSFEKVENPGIDIAIFGKHPFYTFHLYRVSSIHDLRSIKTMLSLLISIDPAEFKGEESAAQSLEEEQEDEEQSAELGAQGQEATTASEAVALAQQEPSEEQGDFMLDSFGMIDDTEEVEAGGEAVVVPLAPQKAEAHVKPLAQLADEDVRASLPAVPASKKKKQEAPPENVLEEVLTKEKQKSLASSFYFLSRLTQYDKGLFAYDTGKVANKYSTMCQSQDTKQPAIMSEEEYQETKDLYEADEEAGDILWIEYPLKKGASIPAPRKDHTEVFTVLRYGSRIDKQNVFVCSRFWCRRDAKIILAKDFVSTRDREGNEKPANSCPFCGDGLVRDPRKLVKGESVLERKTNKFQKKHTSVSFLKKTGHPDGLFLPCCFTTPHHLKETDPAFASRKRVLPKADPTGEASDEEEEEEGESPVAVMSTVEELSVGTKPIPANYAKKLASVTSSYILGSDKLPLAIMPRDGPQIGILPPVLNRFFAQNASKLVKQDHTVWKLMTDNTTGLPNVTGFFRIASENRKYFIADSFLSAVAPYYGYNSATELKARILDVVQPHIFLALNYGNFLFDFYDPQFIEPNTYLLLKFSIERLGLAAIGSQKEAMIRAWKAYMNFERSLSSTTFTKEYRQFGPLFTQPLLLSSSDKRLYSNGILFIVLEVNSDGSVKIRCPPYGVSKAQAERCDIAFITYYPNSGIWEPIFYTVNQPQEEYFDSYMVFRREHVGRWPAIVKQRVEEFTNMCQSSGMGMYTDSPQVNTRSLIPVSKLVNVAQEDVYGILRDSYNHVSAVLFLIDESIVVVPCIDDGTIFPRLKVELDWRNFMNKLARADEVQFFYTMKLRSLLKTFGPEIQASYKLGELFELDSTVQIRKDILAFQLGNGLFVPVRKSTRVEMESVKESERFVEGQELPWSIDAKLVYGKEAEADSTLTLDHKEFQEIYQHLRLTFSNWLAIATPEFKQVINETLFYNGDFNYNIPLYEKRQRLLLRLGPLIESWLDDSAGAPNKTPSLKRVDCRVIGAKEECSNACIWKGEQEEGKCMLHVPRTYEVGTNEVPAIPLLIKKLIEELIRFPERRDEVLQQRVSQYQVLRDGFRSGNQYIVPENLPAWTELLRMDWRQAEREVPKYVEELTAIQPPSASAPKGAEVKAPPSAPPASNLPDVLKAYFSDKKKGLYFIPSTTGTIWELLGGGPGLNVEEFVEARDIDLDISTFTDEEDAKEAARLLSMGIYQIVYEEDNPVAPEEMIIKAVLPNKQKAPVILLVQLPDGTVGAVSPTPGAVNAIPFDSLPTNLKFNANKASSYSL